MGNQSIILRGKRWGKLFVDAGFIMEKELHDRTRDTTTHFYRYPKWEL